MTSSVVTSTVVTSTVVACCQLAPQLGDPAGNRELVGPNNDVHSDRRPELYGRICAGR